MFASINFAGGMCEYRLADCDDGSIEVTFWYCRDGIQNGMVMDERHPPRSYPNIHRALIAIADEFDPLPKPEDSSEYSEPGW